MTRPGLVLAVAPPGLREGLLTNTLHHPWAVEETRPLSTAGGQGQGSLRPALPHRQLVQTGRGTAAPPLSPGQLESASEAKKQPEGLALDPQTPLGVCYPKEITRKKRRALQMVWSCGKGWDFTAVRRTGGWGGVGGGTAWSVRNGCWIPCEGSLEGDSEGRIRGISADKSAKGGRSPDRVGVPAKAVTAPCTSSICPPSLSAVITC